jgi:hypothetical protein
MKRVLILVEGHAEEAFAASILVPHFLSHGIALTATRICTAREEGRRKFRGGHGSQYSHIRRDVLHLLGDSDAAAVTTMLDYYRLPDDFPGQKTRPKRSRARAQAQHLEEQLAADIGNSRLLPNLIVHEFEALLFSSPDAISETSPGAPPADDIVASLKRTKTPEEIDDGPTTHPAARLQQLVPNYQKVIHGTRIAQAIGLDVMRRKCPKFNAWIETLEQLA